MPYEPEGVRAAHQPLMIRTKDRGGLQTHLAAAVVGTGIHCPISLHLQETDGSLRYRDEDFRVAEEVASGVTFSADIPRDFRR